MAEEKDNFHADLLCKMADIMAKQSTHQIQISNNILKTSDNNKKISLCFIYGMFLLNILFFGYFLIYNMSFEMCEEQVKETLIEQKNENCINTKQNIIIKGEENGEFSKSNTEENKKKDNKTNLWEETKKEIK